MNKRTKPWCINPFSLLGSLMMGWMTSRLDRIAEAIETHNTITRTMATQLDTLIAQVAQTTAVEAAAVTLIQDLARRLSAIATDPVAVSALADQLKASADALAAAIAANTPADPTGQF
jgi:ABC-type transporter Mla subunit MlaD